MTVVKIFVEPVIADLKRILQLVEEDEIESAITAISDMIIEISLLSEIRGNKDDK